MPDFAAARAAGKLRLSSTPPRDLLRLTRFPATEPYWGKGRAYRFDDPLQVFGVTYVARKLDVAFAETVLHEKGLFVDDHWVVDQARIDERHVVSYTHPDKTVLQLAVLAGPSLKGLGLNNDICSSDDYTDSMAVSAAIHAQVPDADGILYVSRQNNLAVAIALFERSGVEVQPTSIPLQLHPDYAAVIDLYDVEVLPRTSPPSGA